MTEQDAANVPADPQVLRAAVLDALSEVAPDVDTAAIDPAHPFRDQFDFDSMDHLNFVTAIHRRFGVDVPELDYPQLSSLDGCLRYLSSRADARQESTHRSSTVTEDPR